MAEFNRILMPAVRKGDVNLLECHLSTVVNPDLYLNQVYNEVDGPQCTVLMIACLNRRENIIRMLLQRFKPDLETLNNSYFEDAFTKRQIFYNVSVLWMAAAMDNFVIVKLLVEHGANINHTTKTKSTPLRCACHNGNIIMARYLIEKGADIHIVNENNETNLMVSVNYNHLDMTIYLIDELNYDVNACDNDGRSALYDAVYCKSLELVELLLKRGARNIRATLDQMSPLMWAAEKRCRNLVDAIASHCSLSERIEAEELFGSAIVCTLYDDRNLEEAFQCFYRALELRLMHNLPKVLRIATTEIFDNRQECQILEELEESRSNLDYMYTEALLIRGRLLGSADKKYHDSLAYRGAVLADEGKYVKALLIWMFELRLRQKYSISFESKQLREIVSLISEILYQSISIPSDALLTLLALMNEELEHHKNDFDYNLYTMLFLNTITAHCLIKSFICETDQQMFYHQLYTINRRRYVTSDHQLSLLHLSLDNHTLVDDHHIENICQYPCLQTVRILLQCGADVNAIDSIRNAPLHVFVSNSKSVCDTSILKLLCDAGAHLDYVNALGKTPFDSAIDPTIKQLLKIRMQLSLKCLCARLIQKNNVPFHGNLSTSLVYFVERH